MAKREPRNIPMSRDWSDLPSDILDLCCSCMDMLSAVRLAACSRDMHAAIIEARPQLFKTPCLLLYALARCAHHDTEAYIMPLDFNLTSISQNFFAGKHSWFLTRSDDGKRLMIIRTHEPAKLYCKNPTVYKHREICEYPESGCYVYEKDTILLGPSGFLSWRRVNNLGSHFLFLGLNYPNNQEITIRKDLDGREAVFARENCVYMASPWTSGPHAPDCQRYNLQPKEGENEKGIWIDFDPWLSQV